ncbi:arylesterase [Sulfurimonas sp. MAG313]|nr:arylesterase [Sulfurimonas sp. MAG313]
MFVLILLSLLFISKEDKLQNIQTKPLSEDAKILAFGDSLTYGKGSPNQSYPLQLQDLLNLKVINAGISGEASSQGLKRLPRLLEKYKPELVILCHGGNDLIRNNSKTILKNNLMTMIHLSVESGAQVLLVGVPNYKFFRFSTESLYEELAEAQKVMYEGNILSKIENDTSLKSDRIHPNSKGYGVMAKAFYEVLKDNKILPKVP